MPRVVALAAPAAWGDDEPEPSSYEPIDIRTYWRESNRWLWAVTTRIRNQSQIPRVRIRRPARSHRARRKLRTVRARARSPGRLADEDPEPDLSAALLSGGVA